MQPQVKYSTVTPVGPTPTIPHNPQQQSAQHYKLVRHSNVPQQVQVPLAKSRIPLQRSTIRERKNAPLVKLSTSLMATYIEINRKINFQRSKDLAQTTRTRAFNNGLDDADHNYIIQLNEIWNDRYRVVRLLGKGSFGQVVEARDLTERKDVAVKIIKNRRAFHYQGMIEVKILEFLNQHDPQDVRNIVRMTSHFEYKNHLCLVYELLSFNLYDLLRNDKFVGVSIELVKKFAVQILQCLEFLAQDDINVIHCDLKPENVLLRNPSSSLLKVIDFGSSCHSNQKLYTYIQSRFYRSPEVIMGHTYNTPIDMWSLGCLLVELLTGRPLFNGINEHDQICRIVEILGAPPHHFMKDCNEDKVNKFFMVGTGAQLMFNRNQLDSFDVVYQIVPSKNFKPKSNASLQGIIAKGIKELNQENQAMFDDFLDLIQRCLQYSPSERIKPSQALKHPFCANQSATQTPTVATHLQHKAVAGPVRRSNRFGGAQCPVKAKAEDVASTIGVEHIANLNIAHRLRPRPTKSVAVEE